MRALHAFTRLLAFAAVIAAAFPVGAQTGSAGTRDASGSTWWRTGSPQVSLGLNLGRSRYPLDCAAGPACDNRDTSWSLYGRHMASEHWGSQLSLVHLGEADRGGGGTRAYGLDLSLVGRVPVASSVGLYGKVGALLGHSRVGAAAGSGLATGTENGLGLSFGAGLNWDFTPRLSAVLEWDRYEVKFPGIGREGVRSTSLGLQYRY